MRGIEEQAKEPPLVGFEHISKHFVNGKALEDITFTIPRGSIFGIIGPNGAGKSTLLKILIGFLKPSSGKILINGQIIAKRSLEVQHLFGYASQKNCFYPELTVKENLQYFGKLYWLSNAQIKKRSKELIEIVGLRGHQSVPAKYLSGGMERKLDIACAMIHAPNILILDEPVAGIDPLSAKQLWKILTHINSLGTTIIVSSHNIEYMDDACSDILILNEGKIIERGNPKYLKAKHTKEIIVNLLTEPPQYDDLLEQLKEDGLAYTFVKEDKNLLLHTNSPEKAVVSIVHHVVEDHKEILDLDIRQPTLTEIFEQIVHENSDVAITETQTYEHVKEAVEEALNNEVSKIKSLLKQRKIPDHIINKVIEEVQRKK